MKKLKGLNEKVAVLISEGDAPAPTFKEVALNTIAIYRPKESENVAPSERLKVTNLGMIFLTAKDTLEIEDEYFEVLKKILNNSKGYSEFIMGQWTKKINETEVAELDTNGKKKGG